MTSLLSKPRQRESAPKHPIYTPQRLFVHKHFTLFPSQRRDRQSTRIPHPTLHHYYPKLKQNVYLFGPIEGFRHRRRLRLW